MKKLALLCCLVMYVFMRFASTPALADTSVAAAPETHWEFTGSTNAYLLITHETDDFGNPFEANLGTHANYFVTPQWEVGGRIGFTTTSGGSQGMWRTSAALTVGPTYNLSNDAANSFFATAQAGFQFINVQASGNTYFPFAFLFGVGRRVGIVDHVTWTPEFAVSGHLRATSDTSFLTGVTEYEFRLFQFSVLL